MQRHHRRWIAAWVSLILLGLCLLATILTGINVGWAGNTITLELGAVAVQLLPSTSATETYSSSDIALHIGPGLPCSWHEFWLVNEVDLAPVKLAVYECP